jgi:Fe-Mn family superoxide dismutase
MDDLTRRDMMKTSALAAAGLAVGAGLAGRASAQDTQATTQPVNVVDVMFPNAFDADGRATLPPLKYDYDALVAAIDEETMRIHHDRHHQGYVNGFNRTLDALDATRASGDFSRVANLSQKLTFHGGGHVLHTIFWDTMGPDGGGAPAGALAEAIERDFGSFDTFKDQFFNVSKSVEGSGWGLLVYHMGTGRLLIQQVQNQNLLSMWAAVPLTGVDVWEHAYYLRYQNRRADYVQAWFDVADWASVGKRYELAAAHHGA